MRNFIFPVIVIFIVLLTFSCTEPSELITSSSPSGKNKIEISATTGLPADPLKVSLKITGGTKVQNTEFAIYAKRISKENCTVAWQNEETVLITFEQRDGALKLIKGYITDEGIYINQQ